MRRQYIPLLTLTWNVHLACCLAIAIEKILIVPSRGQHDAKNVETPTEADQHVVVAITERVSEQDQTGDQKRQRDIIDVKSVFTASKLSSCEETGSGDRTYGCHTARFLTRYV